MLTILGYAKGNRTYTFYNNVSNQALKLALYYQLSANFPMPAAFFHLRQANPQKRKKSKCLTEKKTARR
jgi:Zn/Cd-binding protein ZinT